MRVWKWLVILGIAMATFPLTIQAGNKNVTPESLPGVQVIGVDKVKNQIILISKYKCTYPNKSNDK